MASKNEAQAQWRPARLIPTAGLRTEKDREQRAVSALLAVAAGVPDFGKTIASELGGPRGRLETYVEVPLKDADGRTCYPDGVLLSTLGKKSLRILIEAKTGNDQLSKDQVTNYLDLARRHNFDGLLLITNDVLGGPDDIPIEVPKKALSGGVRLWQLSWWRILTWAIYQRYHQGIEDPEQAWILGELIHYLQHPGSGAAEFSDMGERWGEIRDAAKRDALRRNQASVTEIVQRWDNLVHYVSLDLAQHVGREVAPLPPKRNASRQEIETDHRDRLVDEGRLTATIRVPDTAGDLTVTAHLRSQQVVVATKIAAPEEGRAKTQINWLLRQLDENLPADTRIETRFARTSRTTAALLGEARDDPEVLLLHDDRKREPRAFEIGIAVSMGTARRANAKKSFIRSVRDHTMWFYENVLQDLREWRPAPPKVQRPTPLREGTRRDTPDFETHLHTPES